MTAISLRDLAGMTEFAAAEALQRDVWGAGDKEDPADLMMVIAAEGGLVAGAFQGAHLLGYVFGFPTRKPGVQHSHRLAVRAEARGTGLGLALKWYQRDWCLARGITMVRWTYDPLRAVNAGLNIHRLGARASTYCCDYYGAMAGINQGAPSDRLLVEWQIDSDQVAACAAGRPGLAPDAAASARRIKIPADFAALLRANPEAALGERLKLRSAMQAAFGAGLAVCGYDPATCTYLLSQP